MLDQQIKLIEFKKLKNIAPSLSALNMQLH